MFFGITVPGGSAGTGGVLPGLRQLDDDTLVAVVEKLCTLELLNRVNAEVEFPALEVVDIELRQLYLLDDIELALDASGRPLLVLAGETGRCVVRSRLTREPDSAWPADRPRALPSGAA
jgi:hypothetical protein